MVTATQLPLLVTIFDRMVGQGDIPRHIAAALIGAAVISVTVFPVLGFYGLKTANGNSNGENKIEALLEIPKPVCYRIRLKRWAQLPGGSCPLPRLAALAS